MIAVQQKKEIEELLKCAKNKNINKTYFQHGGMVRLN